MSLKCICIIMLAISATSGEPKKTTAQIKEETPNSINGDDRVVAWYVKDSENGELRFLGASNSDINQFITQQQNILEQLRPNNGNGNLALGQINTGGLGTLGTLGAFGTGTNNNNNNGIAPIIVNLGNGGGGNAAGNANNNNNNGGIQGPSPIGQLLPQIIAQSVLNNRRTQNRNRNRRRGVNNRVFVVRPNAN